MGKNLIQQKRGKGSPRYKAPSFRYKGKTRYTVFGQTNTVKAYIKDIVHCSGHSAPLMELVYANKDKELLQAPEGVRVGDVIEIGANAGLKAGNVLMLRQIPEGTSIFNIEAHPGDGGKFARASGASAKVITKTEDEAVVLLPSDKRKAFLLECKATIGVAAGSGRVEKPFLKAGAKYFAMRAKNKLWPKVSGTSMNAVNHPFGGRSSHAKGIPTQSSRGAPPGAKVGKIAPKRTGRRVKR